MPHTKPLLSSCKTYKALRMINKLILIIIGLNFYSCHTSRSVENNIVHTIPFTLTEHNNISIRAVINKRDSLDLMFHTAANSLDLTKEAVEKVSSIDWDNEAEVNTWGGSSTSRTSKNNILEINGFTWDSLTIWENENSGPTTDGKFGPNLFNGRILEINYNKGVILLHKRVPKYSKDYIKLPISIENGMMFIECLSTIGEDNYANRFLIHSGFGGTILYDDSFAAKSNIGQRIKIKSQQALKDSHGNTLMTKKGEIPLFTIGGFSLENMPVGFFEGSIGRQKMSVLGGDILKRFDIIIDSKRELIYIKPSQLLNSPFVEI